MKVKITRRDGFLPIRMVINKKIRSVGEVSKWEYMYIVGSNITTMEVTINYPITTSDG